ncbi:unnamed protein product [Musa acuminata subsp. malaccensis]|nr:PREDICTED: uncharacterized protein LOC103995178 isoform X1 [Musa acuminata subsp. malaccensis]CAG1832609.1 unnamed protein product [Musa acuminata subsp. malaccensis]
MLKREGLRSCSLHLRTLWSDHASAMALNKLFPSPSRGFSQMSVANEHGRLRRKHLVCMDIGSNNNLSMRGCSDRHDGVSRRADEDIQKAHVVGPHRHLVNGSKMVFSEDMGLSLVNGDGSCKHGKPLEFPGHLKSEKLAVAVDVDEVLGSFLLALNKFIADCYSSNHSVSEYYVYEFYKIWKCSQAEANIRVHEFFKSSYFKTGIYPIPGARHALDKLSTFCNLSVVTSRQNVIKDHTLEWIEKHYPGLFQEIHFGNHFALDGVSRPKSEICRSLGAHVLIDDNPKYALECAEVGIRVLLFDYHNSYPWCKAGSATSHPMVTKVHNWQEVEQQLFSWIPT